MGAANHQHHIRKSTVHRVHTPAADSQPVGPGDESGLAVTGQPVFARLSKVRSPLVRDAVLRRPRLLDWLHTQSSKRLVTVVAGAGSGKTTLLADYSEGTRVPVLWYRLDATDRNGRVFVERLVLSGQQVNRDFAPLTRELLAGPGPAEATQTELVGALLKELPSLAEPSGLLIILDDFHEVDDVPDIESVVLDLLAHGPDRLTVLISTRRQLTLPLARLRLLGEVAELSAGDLNFDGREAEGLFRDIYGQKLDHETVDELVQRTEGWAASLHLVAAAIRPKSQREGRAFIHSLTGADRHLHDYLAEEVIGNLGDLDRSFLMRASLLEEFDLRLSAAAAGLELTEANPHLLAAMRCGLLQGPAGDDGNYRFHPLVRDFLQARLARETSSDALRRLHLDIARAAGLQDWARALHHLVAAGERKEAIRLLSTALSTILARGRYEEAASLSDRLSLGDAVPPLLVLSSRSEFRAGRKNKAMESAHAAVAEDPSNAAALINLMSLAFTTGDLETARRISEEVRNLDLDPETKRISHLQTQLLEVSLAGDLSVFVETFLQAARANRSAGHRHYEGICLVNAAVALRSMGQANEAWSTASDALTALEASSAGPERASARMVRAWVMAHDGDVRSARAEASIARNEGGPAAHVEIALELADLETWFGSDAEADAALQSVPSSLTLDPDQAEQRLLCELGLALRRGDVAPLEAGIKQLRFGEPSTAAAMEARRLAIQAHAAALIRDTTAEALLQRALDHAEAQHAGFWTQYALALRLLNGPAELVRGSLRTPVSVSPVHLSVQAEGLLRWASDILEGSEADLDRVVAANPDRWVVPLRAQLRSGSGAKRLRSWLAGQLDLIGDKSDIPLLREVAKTLPTPVGRLPFGKGVARRLAEPVQIHDLNRVALRVGDRLIAGSDVRRKALALICYLITRPGFSATRDEVMDALWPDTDPAYAINSLNQTAYFLRRVLEPEFAEETSPGYLRYQADLVWLDSDLVSSDAAALMRKLELAARDPRPELLSEISTRYAARFALDFAYDDWSSDFRERLHAAYLSVMESEIRSELQAGRPSRGITLARRALEVDAEATEIELLLVRLYGVAGAHSAAAEQYAHYANAMRDDIGVEVPPLESL